MCEVSAYPNEPNRRQSERRPQNDLEILVLLRSQLLCPLLHNVRIGRSHDTVYVLDGDGQYSITEHPERDQTRTKRLVLVVHGRLFRLFNDIDLRNGTGDSLLEDGVEVFLLAQSVFDDGSVGSFLLR